MNTAFAPDEIAQPLFPILPKSPP